MSANEDETASGFEACCCAGLGQRFVGLCSFCCCNLALFVGLNAFWYASFDAMMESIDQADEVSLEFEVEYQDTVAYKPNHEFEVWMDDPNGYQSWATDLWDTNFRWYEHQDHLNEDLDQWVANRRTCTHSTFMFSQQEGCEPRESWWEYQCCHNKDFESRVSEAMMRCTGEVEYVQCEMEKIGHAMAVLCLCIFFLSAIVVAAYNWSHCHIRRIPALIYATATETLVTWALRLCRCDATKSFIQSVDGWMLERLGGGPLPNKRMQLFLVIWPLALLNDFWFIVKTSPHEPDICAMCSFAYFFGVISWLMFSCNIREQKKMCTQPFAAALDFVFDDIFGMWAAIVYMFRRGGDVTGVFMIIFNGMLAVSHLKGEMWGFFLHGFKYAVREKEEEEKKELVRHKGTQSADTEAKKLVPIGSVSV